MKAGWTGAQMRSNVRAVLIVGGALLSALLACATWMAWRFRTF
jgi:hypothetical protein